MPASPFSRFRPSLRFPLVLSALGVALTGALLISPPATAQSGDGPSSSPSVDASADPASPTWSDAEKIENALSAAPASIAGEAAVWDWPAEAGETPPVLREGRNGWTCFPSRINTPGNDPMCHDEAFLAWALAFLAEEEPSLERVGLSYMLQGGGLLGENGQQTVGPHVMIALPDLADARGIPHVHHDEQSPLLAKPFISYGDTPYALVIMPLAPGGQRLTISGLAAE
jgi:hypothetical protein